MHPAPLTLRQTRLARSTLTRPLLLRQHRSYYSAAQRVHLLLPIPAAALPRPPLPPSPLHPFIFLPCRLLLVLHAFVIPPSAAAHTRERALLYLWCNATSREIILWAPEREAPLFSYSQGFLFPNCIIWGVVPQQRHGNFSHFRGNALSPPKHPSL